MSDKNRKIFVLQPFNPSFNTIYTLIKAAASELNATVFRLDTIAAAGNITEKLYEAIDLADLIICDITDVNPNVMYELGYAHAQRKPVILISQGLESMPFDIRSVRVILYVNEIGAAAEFITNLKKAINHALKDPRSYSNLPKTETSIKTVFISYCHKDVEFINRLRVHLRPLEKKGLIDLWDDSKIHAGDLWKVAIAEALSRARVAILIITADFLASEFIAENELPPLLSKAEAEGTRIIPLIAKPCRFTREKSLSAFQAINDPKSSLIALPEGKQEEVYDNISEIVEILLGQ
jgi:hypothetical protein